MTFMDVVRALIHCKESREARTVEKDVYPCKAACNRCFQRALARRVRSLSCDDAQVPSLRDSIRFSLHYIAW